MNIPASYMHRRKSLPEEVNFGCGGIKLFPCQDIEPAQLGYSLARDGSSLCTADEGAWRPSWLVIGCETSLGDPIFIDTEDAAMPVFSARHGEGAWEPDLIASSIDSFGKCLDEFSQIAAGRTNPAECEANPIGDEERKQFLDKIAKHNQTTRAPEFWSVLLELS